MHSILPHCLPPCLNISKYLAYTNRIVTDIANINYTECIEVILKS